MTSSKASGTSIGQLLHLMSLLALLIFVLALYFRVSRLETELAQIAKTEVTCGRTQNEGNIETLSDPQAREFDSTLVMASKGDQLEKNTLMFRRLEEVLANKDIPEQTLVLQGYHTYSSGLQGRRDSLEKLRIKNIGKYASEDSQKLDLAKATKKRKTILNIKGEGRANLKMAFQGIQENVPNMMRKTGMKHDLPGSSNNDYPKSLHPVGDRFDDILFLGENTDKEIEESRGVAENETENDLEVNPASSTNPAPARELRPVSRSRRSAEGRDECDRTVEEQKRYCSMQHEALRIDSDVFECKAKYRDLTYVPCSIWESVKHHSTCRNNYIRVFEADIPLHCFVENIKTGAKPNDKRVAKFNASNGEFQIVQSGTFIVEARLTFIDKQHNHWAGLYLGNVLFYACNPGGFSAFSNGRGRSHIRICHIQGVLDLKKGDKLTMNVMEKHTKVITKTGLSSTIRFMVLDRYAANQRELEAGR